MAASPTVLVSGFLPLQRRGPSPAEYMQRAAPLLSLRLPKIIFMPSQYMDICRDAAHAGSTTLVPFEMEDLDREMPMDTAWALPTDHAIDHDTHKYMQIILQKTGWMCRAAEMVPEPARTHFLWVDLGLIHVFPQRDARMFQAAVRAAATGAAGLDRAKVRIAGIWPLPTGFAYTEMWAHAQQRVLWYLAGGVFGGCGPALRAFESEVQEELERVRSHKRWMWEVNVWALVLARKPELFDVYHGSHNASILLNYANPSQK